MRHLARTRWPNGVTCPSCSARTISELHSESRYHCNRCNRSFSATSATLFHHTHSDLQKWFLAIDLLLHSRRVISIRRLSRSIQINKNTAWHMKQRIIPALKKERRFLEEIVAIGEQ